MRTPILAQKGLDRIGSSMILLSAHPHGLVVGEIGNDLGMADCRCCGFR